MPRIRSINDTDRQRLREQLTADWGSTRVATRGRLVDAAALPGFLVEEGGEWLGYAAYELRDTELEVTVIESLAPGRGAGGALLAECVRAAQAAGATRVLLVTTNDNMAALRFYQRRGFVLVALRPGAVDDARSTLKPAIPERGNDDIPIHDEIELELPVAAWPEFVERHKWPST
jgi:GNAT superfamily N-acetyltransferase